MSGTEPKAALHNARGLVQCAHKAILDYVGTRVADEYGGDEGDLEDIRPLISALMSLRCATREIDNGIGDGDEQEGNADG